MAIFSKTCEYAIRAVFFIAQKTTTGNRIGIRDISIGIDSPELYTGKIMQNLSRQKLVSSVKGPNGGFYIDEAAKLLPIIEIVKAIDGSDLFEGCALGLAQCSENEPCPLHHELKEIRNRLTELLTKTTIGEFNEQLLNGLVSLKR